MRVGVFILIWLMWGGLKGEGTAQLMPSGSSSSCKAYVQGNDGSGKEGPGYGRPTTDLLHIRIVDPLNETIYLGLTRLEPSSKPIYYQVLDPEGNVHCSGQVAENSGDLGYVADDGIQAYVGPVSTGGASGYSPIECVPSIAGDYLLQFNVSDSLTATPSESRYYIHPFDVTVADVSDTTNRQAINGRLYTYRWHLNTNSSSNKACMDFYTWTPDSLVMMMDMNEIQPFGFTVSFNSTGTGNSGNIVSDRQSTTSTSTTIAEYPVFLNEPDSVAFPSGTPGEVVYIEVNACTQDQSYCILVNTTKLGEMNIYIDLDGDGVFSTSGVGKDVYFPYRNTSVGEICIPWDGVNGEGDTISANQKGLVKVEFLAGIVHFPIWDAETHANGFNCSLIRPSGFSPQMYFDNSQTGIGTSNMAGCSSGCNSWSSNQGDKVMVNTWLNTITSSDQDSLIVGQFCPPVAVNDTLCTRPSHGIQAAILSNDWDPDNDLDTSSVMLDTLDPSKGSISFDAQTALLTFFPNGDDSSTVNFWYRLSDQTSVEDGGPLTDSAKVVIYITASCTATVILPLAPIFLQADHTPSGIRLNWRPLLHAVDPVYLIEKSKDGKRFRPIAETRQNRFLDKCGEEREKRHQRGNRVYYRVRMIELGEGKAISNVLSIRLRRPENIHFRLFQTQQDRLILKYRSPEEATFALYDLAGHLLHQQRLSPAIFEQRVGIQLPRIKGGVYLGVIHSEEGYVSQKVALQ